MVEISSASASSGADHLSWSPHRKGAKVIRFSTSSSYHQPNQPPTTEMSSENNTSPTSPAASERSSTERGGEIRTAAIYRSSAKGLSPAIQLIQPVTPQQQLVTLEESDGSGLELTQYRDVDVKVMAKHSPARSWSRIEHYLPNNSWFEPRPKIDRVVGLTLHCFTLSMLVLVRVGVKMMSSIAYFLAFMFLHSAVENDKLVVIPLDKETVTRSSIAQMGDVHLILGKVEPEIISSALRARIKSTRRCSPKHSRRKDCKDLVQFLSGGKTMERRPSCFLPNNVPLMNGSAPLLRSTANRLYSDLVSYSSSSLEKVSDISLERISPRLNDPEEAFDLSDSSENRKTLTQHTFDSEYDYC